MNDNNNSNTQSTNINKNNKKNNPTPALIIFLVILMTVIGTNMLMHNKNNTTKRNRYDDGEEIIFDKDGDFLLAVEDTYIVASDIVGAVGIIERGSVKPDDEVQIIGMNKKIKTVKVIGLNIGEQSLDYAEAGSDKIEITLRSVKPSEVVKGQVLAAPNSIQETKNFNATFKLYSKENGGRNTPIFSGYHPKIFFRTIDIDAEVTLPENIEMINPGEEGEVTVLLKTSVAMEIGTKFSINEEGKTSAIGQGIVTQLN